MNKITQLFDEKYVLEYFKKELLPKYSDFKDIKKIKILPVKKNIWQTTYHVVIEFVTTFIRADGKIKKLPIYCSAHSDEPRKNSYLALKFLWDHEFWRGHLTTPRPLFYSKYFNAVFYRGVKGNNLYHFIRENNKREIELIIPKAAAWFAKLHKLNISKAKNFNRLNSRISTVIPGMEHTLNKIKEVFPYYYEAYRRIYEVINSKEEKFLADRKKRWLIHGDAHPENVIKISKNKIAVIDFTDLCLADFARDLGAFLQQLEFMAVRKIGDPAYIEKIKNLFLNNYLTTAKIKPDDSLKERINYYYNWTSLRTASFFLLNEKPEPERADGLIKKILSDLKLDLKI